MSSRTLFGIKSLNSLYDSLLWLDAKNMVRPFFMYSQSSELRFSISQIFFLSIFFTKPSATSLNLDPSTTSFSSAVLGAGYSYLTCGIPFLISSKIILTRTLQCHFSFFISRLSSLTQTLSSSPGLCWSVKFYITKSLTIKHLYKYIFESSLCLIIWYNNSIYFSPFCPNSILILSTSFISRSFSDWAEVLRLGLWIRAGRWYWVFW